jgi:hypothetical protein
LLRRSACHAALCLPARAPGGTARRTGAVVVASQLIVVDVANVFGSRPDGWWRDQVGATRELLDKIARLPLQDQQVILVLEGRARASAAEGGCLRSTPPTTSATIGCLAPRLTSYGRCA